MMDAFKTASDWHKTFPESAYVEGWAAISDRIELRHHAWLLDEDGEVTDPTWGNNLPFPVYIGTVVTPNADGTPVLTDDEMSQLLKEATDAR